jgi:2-polyprenyl-3-methyl-5-hydroxy-6-metoxy-1,4-benzoquinol methylase
MKTMEYFKVNYRPFLPADRESAILDFGCGAGAVLSFLQQEGYVNISGVDIHSYDTWPAFLSANIQVKEIDNSAEYLRSNPGKYDLIVVKDVIYYFREDEVFEIVRLLKSALKPNGKIIFEIFNGSTLTGPFVKYKDIDIRLILTEHSMVTLIERAGMKPDAVKGNTTIVSGVRSLIYKIVNTVEILFLKTIYFSERGVDDQNPKIFSRKIIVLASPV